MPAKKNPKPSRHAPSPRASASCRKLVAPRPPEPALRWIAELAEPYLRGFTPRVQNSGSLRGSWFLNPSLSFAGNTQRTKKKPASETSTGFFVGYLLSNRNFAFLKPQPPECLVFAFVHPVGGNAHRQLVDSPASLMRHTFEYIRWLTHRPPRFEFYACGTASLVRHSSMLHWPRAKHRHYSRNFFIESLAWLVRSGLVKKLLSEQSAAIPGRASRKLSAPGIPR